MIQIIYIDGTDINGPLGDDPDDCSTDTYGPLGDDTDINGPLSLNSYDDNVMDSFIEAYLETYPSDLIYE